MKEEGNYTDVLAARIVDALASRGLSNADMTLEEIGSHIDHAKGEDVDELRRAMKRLFSGKESRAKAGEAMEKAVELLLRRDAPPTH